MIIDNVKIYTEAGTFVSGGIITQGDKITEIYTEAEKENIFKKMNMETEHTAAQCSVQDYSAKNDIDNVLDGKGAYAIPGLIDLHFHGCVGDDFCDGDKEAIRRIAEYEVSVGVTAIAPATMTLPVAELENILKTAAAYKKEYEEDSSCIGEKMKDEDEQAQNMEAKQQNITDEACDALKTTAVSAKVKNKKRADFVGINMEGPFLDPAKKGAHVEKWIAAPDVAFVRELNQDADGLVRLVTLAPNMDGAEEFIKEMHEEVCISLGHTAADYDCASRAMKLGAHHVTHLYNAMQPFGHRAPGLIGAAMDDPECMVELICDGYHIHPSAIRAAFRMFGPERVILISDSMRATGMENGTYELGGQEVTVKDRKAVLKDGTLAGSATNLYGCMCKAVEFGIPLEQAIMAATANPARSIGIFDCVGSIRIGKQADLLLVSENFELKRVI